MHYLHSQSTAGQSLVALVGQVLICNCRRTDYQLRNYPSDCDELFLFEQLETQINDELAAAAI